jgi:outer membrane lipoprotein-sorting protein
VTIKIACTTIAAAMLGITSLQPIVAQQPTDPLDDLFARGRAAQAATKTITATFIETSVSSLLREPLVATGTLVAAMPIRVVMHYTTPTIKTVALDDKHMVIAWPSGNREDLDIAETQRRVQRYFTDASPKQLRDLFTITLSSDLKDTAYTLEMVPRRKQIADGVNRLRIWTDRDRLLMSRMTLDFPGGNSKTLELHDLRTNVPIDEGMFAILARKK